ncbi:hypothetical protein PUNSTDRAFT_83105 [Punctularia strigosozonata HHB-11173 SS5]|uniref:uncharacterized protein n=1 Tax=Punctularia strigosozonata (strain HHB-11173) TaxID=741275 RepID=UPI0004416B40|nr:uncharacterized protein PUNSTDRAFT_83105 [Punctularia strigosozonata HHB-11173 SS5]EIN11480.1 hypothetical protein PUNSTDRAFT_83105 [Punctularia strigosozonata HHB-11173 SS5]
MSDLDYSDDDYFDDDEDMGGADDDSAPSDDDMDIDFNDDIQTALKEKKKVYEVEYDSLSQQEVEKHMRSDIEGISSIFGVDANTAALLLRHMNWNKERLTEKYMDNADAVLVAAGITQPPPPRPSPSATRSPGASTSSGILSNVRRAARRSPADSARLPSRSTPPPRAPSPAPFVCPICFDDTQTDTLSLDCAHAFCTGCWNAYMTSKIRGEGEHVIRCMAEGCQLVANDDFVRKALGDDTATWQRFQELLVRDYVAANKRLKFCPYPSCNYTVSCPAASTKSSLATIVPTVTCGGNAAHQFCFGCDIDADHRPCVCAVAKMWLKKCADDSETANWIKSNTKECSKCQSTIEKNGGCNHMTCKKCKHEFCWVCMGPWSEHGTSWYSCNRFDEKAGVDARDAQSKSRASLERYLHYYNRWANHEQSAKLQLELYAKTEKKMEEMQISSALTWIEVQFMKKAVDEVFKCRMTLKWTYAMAYYLSPGNAKELFEDNQSDLEQAVEELSGLLEAPFEAADVAALRQKVTDKTVYVQKRNEIMLEDTAVGFQEGRWRFNAPVDGFENLD